MDLVPKENIWCGLALWICDSKRVVTLRPDTAVAEALAKAHQVS